MADSEARLKDLLVRGRGGDADVYHAFLTELSSHLRGFFRKRLTQMPDAVEDILQETLIAVHNQRHTYSPEYPLTAWVHAIAKYKLADFLRRYARHEALSDSLDEVDEVFGVSDAAAHDARRDINELLLRLPDRQRLPLLHVKIEGMSVIETAALTGMSVSAVKVGIHRGLKALAAKLRDSS